jgi:actin-like ATPase involved in cell morphogenesis
VNGGQRRTNSVAECASTVKKKTRQQTQNSNLDNIMAKALGIDLGTANSCVAVIEGGEPSVLEKPPVPAHS